jgi:hypothetical protein
MTVEGMSGIAAIFPDGGNASAQILLLELDGFELNRRAGSGLAGSA